MCPPPPGAGTPDGKRRCSLQRCRPELNCTVGTVRLGTLLLPTDPWKETIERAQRLEEMGYDHLWVYDHLSWQRYRDRPWHSTYPWLAGLASHTTRIRLGTMVANPNIRHPLTLAKDAMTLDHISDGRFTLGVGAGGSGFDATILGRPPLSLRCRAARFEEFVRVLDELLSEGRCDFLGDWYEVREGRVLPGCVQHPRLPIAIAAAGPRGLAMVADRGDAWITHGDPLMRETSASATERIVREQFEMVKTRCDVTGRDPAEIQRVYLIGHTEARPLDSVAAFVDFAGRYEALGFTDLVFHHPRQDDQIWCEPEKIVEQIAAALLQ